MKTIGKIPVITLLFPLFLNATTFDGKGFQTRLNQLLTGKSFNNVTMGIAVSHLPSGDSLFYLNENKIFMPASTIKLILTATALQYYQLNTCFQVPIYYDGAFDNGVINGNVYLKGSGAPTVLLDSLKQAVVRLRQTGLVAITGNVIYDDFDFDAQQPRFPPYARDRWAAGGALVLNSNRIALKITARSPKFLFEKVPDTDYAKIFSTLTYSATDKPSSPDMQYIQKPNGDEFTLKGTVTRWTERTNYLALGATRPGLYFATVFKETLEASGIRVSGKIIPGPCPQQITLLAHIWSPPLRHMLLEMNTASDNIIAENLFRKIGLDKKGAPGNAQKGGEALKQLVASITPANDFSCADGSGLSPNSRITPATFIRLLGKFYQKPELLTVLPEEAMSTTQLKVLGKSGTLSVQGVNALAGYIQPQNAGDAYAFVIFGHRQPNPSKLWSGTLTHPVMKLLLESIRTE